MHSELLDLASLRKTKGLSQAELAESAGVSQATISRIETGESEPTLAVLAKISKALEIELREIVPQERLEGLLGQSGQENFYAFCPNPLCSKNEIGRYDDGGCWFRWKSGAVYPVSRFDEINFCSKCGTELAKACPGCGRRLEDKGTEFCVSCGTKITPRPTEEDWKAIDYRLEPVDDDIPF